MPFRFFACALATLPFASFSCAHAQIAPARTDAGANIQTAPPPSIVMKGTSANYPKPQVQFPQLPLPEGKTLSGPLASVGRSLADKGVHLRFLVVDEFAGSVSGGQDRGAGNSYALPFGTDIDLERMLGLKGSFIHLSMNVSKGTSLSADHAGNAISFQTRYKAFQNLRLAALAIEQNLLDGKVNISGGRVSPLTYFNQSKIYCTFQNNSVCFNPSVVPIQDRALGFFPYGTWGGRVKVAPTKSFYVQAGLFEANPSLNSTNGFDWSTRGSTGRQTAVEVGFQSSSPKAPYPWHVRIGGYHNTSDVADPYLNTKGQPRLVAGGTPLQHRGQTGWYVMGDVVAAHLHGDGKRPVTLFGGLVGSTANYVPFTGQAIAGVILTGPLAGRPHDTLGLVGSYLRIGDRQVDYLQASRAAAGGTDRVRRGEAIFELNYGMAAGRHVRISPNIQYVVNPDNFLRPAARKQSGDILAFGLRLSVDIAGLLGLPGEK
jgi:Carbohydrate-selective porin